MASTHKRQEVSEAGTIAKHSPTYADEALATRAITSELTGTQRHCAAGRMRIGTPSGAVPLRVRVERPVSPQHSALGYFGHSPFKHRMLLLRHHGQWQPG
jgi:hypothetical protein